MKRQKQKQKQKQSLVSAAKELGKSRLVVLRLVAMRELEGEPGPGNQFFIYTPSLRRYKLRNTVQANAQGS